MLVVLVSYLQLWSQNALGISSYFVLIFAVVTLLHQGVIYYDMHQLDHAPQLLIAEYREWVNTRLERFLRLGIFIALLFGVGVLGDALFPLLQKVHISDSPDHLTVALKTLRSTIGEFLQPTNESSKTLYVKGSILLFLLLCIWNSCAVYFRFYNSNFRSVLQRYKSAGSKSKYIINEVITDTRIIIFVLLTALSTAYWLIVFSGDKEEVDHMAELLIVVYIFFFLVFAALKNARIRSRVSAKIEGFVERAQSHET